ncbi:MAG: histidine kinase [Cyanomargarita calcarea GSE-NOS-MK-12-04C]|jgi:translation initiation factor 1 (eIF-1/SUI1)|uniref:Histidine kinase n=1 Tax=Cyanomargarita calcarea GSE-NOS-MK-12-04C TaxID=2839659 RepID=A0A951UYW4_9CYAN|nr:histidine kinase [Cyanomargarita calcarea GSE-NOS-MK-12-04C]
MVVGLHKRAVGVFTNRRDAEHALHELRDSSFPMDKISVVAQNTDGDSDIAGAEVREKVGDKSDEGAKVGAVSGGALGGLTGLLVGLGTLAIPGIGPIMLAGATATALATTLAGVGIGAAAGSLLGALVGLGIPEERARIYNERVERGQYLVMIDGTDAEIAKAEAILRHGGIEEFGIYNHPNGTSAVAENYSPVPAMAGVGTAPLHRNKRAIGVFYNRRDTEGALTELRDAGFPMNQVSVIAKDAGNDVDDIAGANVGNKADEGAKTGAVTGATVGGLTGLLVGLGTLAIPGVGPVILAGEVATALATALTGSAIGAAAGGIVGGLAGLGIPEDQARIYSDRFNKGHYLVMVEGTDFEVNDAEKVLKRRGIEDFSIYDAADGADRKLNVAHNRADIDTTRTDYSAVPDSDASVIIIDRRDETV